MENWIVLLVNFLQYLLLFILVGGVAWYNLIEPVMIDAFRSRLMVLHTKVFFYGSKKLNKSDTAARERMLAILNRQIADAELVSVSYLKKYIKWAIKAFGREQVNLNIQRNVNETEKILAAADGFYRDIYMQCNEVSLSFMIHRTPVLTARIYLIVLYRVFIAFPRIIIKSITEKQTERINTKDIWDIESKKKVKIGGTELFPELLDLQTA